MTSDEDGEWRGKMTERIPGRLAKMAAALLAATALLAIGATAASAAVVMYNNTNTVAPGTEDTFSECYIGCGHTSAGGMVEFGGFRRGIKNVYVQVDNFNCEAGTYLENCFSKPKKKMHYPITLKMYAVTPTLTRGALLTEVSETAKLPYRPSTNASCPSTPEGKGFGSNCDVGGYLGKVKFKLGGYVAPNRVVFEITSTVPSVNLGFEEAYKEWDEATQEFIGTLGSGAPAFGSDPLPGEVFLDGVAHSGYTGAMPVFEVTS